MDSKELKQGNENSDLRKTLNKSNAITNPTNFQNKSNLPLNLIKSKLNILFLNLSFF